MKLLVNAPTGLQEITDIGDGGDYFDAARVIWDERTDRDLPDITLGGMERSNGELIFSQSRMDFHLAALKALSALAYQAQRAAEYPPMSDYLDGIVKGDTAQVQAYIDSCLAVKLKYPKPE